LYNTKILKILNLFWLKLFSKLARIKNKYRTSSSQENVNSFMVLYTESDVLEVINTHDIIKEFASQKSRKIFYTNNIFISVFKKSMK